MTKKKDNHTYHVFPYEDGGSYEVVKIDERGDVIDIYQYTRNGCECPDYCCRVAPGHKANCKHGRILMAWQKGNKMKRRSDLNDVKIMGYCTKDPVLRSTQSGKSVVTFTLAVNKYFGVDDQGVPKKDATFVRVTAWERQAEIICDIVRKGTRLLVCGELRQNNFQDDQGNNKSHLYVLIGREHSFEVVQNGHRKEQEDGADTLDQPDE